MTLKLPASFGVGHFAAQPASGLRRPRRPAAHQDRATPLRSVPPRGMRPRRLRKALGARRSIVARWTDSWARRVSLAAPSGMIASAQAFLDNFLAQHPLAAREIDLRSIDAQANQHRLDDGLIDDNQGGHDPEYEQVAARPGSDHPFGRLRFGFSGLVARHEIRPRKEKGHHESYCATS